MNYYDEIKEYLLNNEITKKVKDYSKNKSDLETYFKVGELLNNAGKNYGEGVIKKYSIKLTNELNIKYDVSSLNKMRKFYNLIKKLATVSPKLSYSHYIELLPYDDLGKVKYYIKIIQEQNLSVRQLRNKIKNNEYERLDDITKLKLMGNVENNSIKDLLKNPIVIKNSSNYEIISEKILQKLILEDIPSFLNELGEGFCFIDNEHKIKIGDRYNYIDLLLFNIKFNCYVVVELKITELKKEHIGQIEIYMNYIDKNIKSINHDKTIGIIIVIKGNRFILEYSSDRRIFETTYRLV